MSWAAVFIVFFVTHQAGDYLFQTDWEALHKHGGLGRDRVARRALFTHTFTYSLAYVPAFVWISSRLGWSTLLVAAAVCVPHGIQDDGRLLSLYMSRVKDMDAAAHRSVAALVDQACHMVALFGAALLVSALL